MGLFNLPPTEGLDWHLIFSKILFDKKIALAADEYSRGKGVFFELNGQSYKITPTVTCTVLTGKEKREAVCGTIPSAEFDERL
jgi:hypothetical protein